MDHDPFFRIKELEKLECFNKRRFKELKEIYREQIDLLNLFGYGYQSMVERLKEQSGKQIERSEFNCSLWSKNKKEDVLTLREYGP